MTDEERQRTIEFILEHQAQLTVNQEQAEERLAGVEERVSRLETAMRELAESQAEMSRTQGQMSIAQERMSIAQEQMLRAQTHMNEVVAVMVDAQTRTDERLNALIATVERHISHGHNGHSESK